LNGALLLDYGRTLVDGNDVPTIFGKALHSLGYHDIERSLLVEAATASRSHWGSNYAHLRRGERWTEPIRIDCNTQVLRALGLHGDLESLSVRVTREWSDHQELRLFDDVVPTLEELSAREIQLGIVSQNLASSASLTAELRRLGVVDFFSVVLTSEECGYDKPDSRLFLRASELIGIPPRDLTHVGDDYDRDVLGARNAGITPILIDRVGKQDGRDCLVIRSMTELSRVLAAVH
jgi:HAD superfamily hydrolase (TIGR01549 family)